MTTYSKRRGRRSLAAILAAMLIASVLAVVAGSPAQAANTSFEVRVDHDNNAKTATVREFAGQDRYDTALRVAKNFATAQGGLGAVPAAFIASGESLVDSISVAGLAGYVNAPILLTPSDSLHGGVADFIEDYGVGTVYVLGGSAAISDATVDAIEGLTSKPKATRVAGADRYATAAAIAAMIDTDTSWCGTSAVSAVLINGSSDMMPFGVAVQTTAFRLQLPVLMTAADMLPDATADFISDNDVEHVQIIGGADTVSADVASALTTLGVDTAARVDGDSAAAVSVALAELAGNGCGDSLGLVSTDRVALVRGNPDGVVAAPMLASSLTGGSLVTPLVVGDSLPAAVRDYLAATPKAIGTTKLNLGIVAVGGTAAVSEATMKAALDAAASADGLTVKIGALTDTDKSLTPVVGDDPVRPQSLDTSSTPPTPQIGLYFSDAVMSGDAALLAKIRDVLQVNGVAANVGAATLATGTPGACSRTMVTVTLRQALKAGDKISIGSSALKFGAGADQRTVGGASATVAAAPADRTRPTISIVGIAKSAVTTDDFGQKFHVTFSDNVGLASDAQLATSEVTVIAGTGGTAVTSPTVTHTAGATTATVDLDRDLVVGDKLVIKPGAVADTSGNKSAGTSGSAFTAQASPTVTSVLMSNLDHSVQTKWQVPDEFFPSDAPGTNEITITAKKTGDAAGAAGNDWTILFDTKSTYDAAKTADINVSVSAQSKQVSVTFVNGPATVGSLLAALKADSDFDARFAATTGCTADAKVKLEPSPAAADRDKTATLVNAAGEDQTSGIGRTRFAIEVRFNKYIATADNTELLKDVLARTVGRNSKNSAADTVGELRTLLGVSSNDDAIVGGAPGTKVRYQMTTASVAYLPMARDLVDVEAGHQGAATVRGENPVIPAVAAVATGYAADTDTGAVEGTTTATDNANDKVDEDKNGARQRRITVSSSVKPYIAPAG